VQVERAPRTWPAHAWAYWIVGVAAIDLSAAFLVWLCSGAVHGFIVGDGLVLAFFLIAILGVLVGCVCGALFLGVVAPFPRATVGAGLVLGLLAGALVSFGYWYVLPLKAIVGAVFGVLVARRVADLRRS
jgi:hypothetical protein